MEYREVTIYTTTQGIEPLTLMLNDLGINGFVIEDAADFEEFITEVTPHWDYVDESLMSKRDVESNVKIYLPDNDQGVEQLAMVTEAVEKLKASGEDFGRLELVLNQVKDEDWANNWKRFFKPLKVGEKFLIKPSWEDCPDTEGRHVLEIDPGNAFGSGTHETTKLCIGLLEGVVKEGAEALDMGCGSGILAVAALLCGAQHVTAVDIDEAAVKTAGENMERNGFTAYTALCGNVLGDDALASSLGDAKYDVIAANIVADVLIAMTPLFDRWLKADGHLIVSGIIGSRAEDVRNALEAGGFTVCERRQDNDWVAYCLHR